jgi:hypothetical protein
MPTGADSWENARNPNRVRMLDPAHGAGDWQRWINPLLYSN